MQDARPSYAADRMLGRYIQRPKLRHAKPRSKSRLRFIVSQGLDFVWRMNPAPISHQARQSCARSCERASQRPLGCRQSELLPYRGRLRILIHGYTPTPPTPSCSICTARRSRCERLLRSALVHGNANQADDGVRRHRYSGHHLKLNRTPGLRPLVNSTPAASRTWRRLVTVLGRIFSPRSKRTIVWGATLAAAESFFIIKRSAARAIRDCTGSTGIALWTDHQRYIQWRQ
jgi:hypothetical protein